MTSPVIATEFAQRSAEFLVEGLKIVALVEDRQDEGVDRVALSPVTRGCSIRVLPAYGPAALSGDHVVVLVLSHRHARSLDLGSARPHARDGGPG